MKRILLLLFIGILFIGGTGCAPKQADLPADSSHRTINEDLPQEELIEKRIIRIYKDDLEVLFELNDSKAAQSLYEQLPLTIETEKFGDNEIIFYPPSDLNTLDAPFASGNEGTLASYTPWGNVILYYDDFTVSDEVIELGKAIKNQENLVYMNGTITIEAMIEPIQSEVGQTTMKISATIHEIEYPVVLADNEAARTFIAKLPMTIKMSPMNGNEKYYYLEEGLPTQATKPASIQSGDLMLFGSDCLVLFHENFKTNYSYTPIGYLENAEKLDEVVGQGEVEVTFSLIESEN